MRYATVTAWADYFEAEDGIRINQRSIFNRLQKTEVIGVTARNRIGLLVKDAYYSENDVKSACHDLLKPMPKADESGFFVKDRIRYGTVHSWGEELNIVKNSIYRLLRKTKLQAVDGKDRCGKITKFYTEADIRSVCVHLLQDVPQVDKSGFFEKDGIRFGSVKSWSEELGIGQRTILTRLKKVKIRTTKCRNGSGRIFDYYPESDIRSLCSDVLTPMPQADESGFFEIDGVLYGNIKVWAEELGIAPSCLTEKIRQEKVEGVDGKYRTTKGIAKFYPEPEVRQSCADLLQPLPQADEAGFFEKDGDKYGTAYSWSYCFPISDAAIQSRLNRSGAKRIKGKDRGGRIATFYSQSDISSACADLIEKQSNPKAA